MRNQLRTPACDPGAALAGNLEGPDRRLAERDIKFHPSKRVVKIDAARKIVSLDDSSEMTFDLFLGVPRHRVPSVVLDSGLAENGWVTVNPRTLETKFPDIYAIGDGANTGRPKPGFLPRERRRRLQALSSLRWLGKANQSGRTMV
jgi:sulfide:quinone oxidoreductase